MPVPGANDGASGVAVLLGLADVLKATPPTIGVDLLFVDGEDYGDFNDSTETLIGARYFAKHQPTRLHDALRSPARYGRRQGSAVLSGGLLDGGRAGSRAARLADGGPVGLLQGVHCTCGQTLIDDHVPLQQAGIRAIDVIDFDFPYHHTTEDTIDKVSARVCRLLVMSPLLWYDSNRFRRAFWAAWMIAVPPCCLPAWH